MLRLGVRVRLMPQEEQKVGDRVQWIANFVRNGGRQASGLPETVAGTERLFGLAPLGDVAEYQHHTPELPATVHDGSAIHFNGIFPARTADEQDVIREAHDFFCLRSEERRVGKECRSRW